MTDVWVEVVWRLLGLYLLMLSVWVPLRVIAWMLLTLPPWKSDDRVGRDK